MHGGLKGTSTPGRAPTRPQAPWSRASGGEQLPSGRGEQLVPPDPVRTVLERAWGPEAALTHNLVYEERLS